MVIMTLRRSTGIMRSTFLNDGRNCLAVAASMDCIENQEKGNRL